MGFKFTQELVCRGVKQVFPDMSNGAVVHMGDIAFNAILNGIGKRRVVVGTEFSSSIIDFRWDYAVYDDFVLDIGGNKMYVRMTLDDK